MGGSGSRTTKWDIIVAALDLGLQSWRTTASRDRFIDAGAEVGHARVAYEEEQAGRVRAEEALRELREAVQDYDSTPATTDMEASKWAYERMVELARPSSLQRASDAREAAGEGNEPGMGAA